MTTPITPQEAVDKKISSIPPDVFNVFNDLIVENIEGTSATVRQKDIVSRLVAKGFDKNEIFDKKWLDIEPYYRKSGWSVTYDKPGYNENYDAFFEFKKRKRRHNISGQ